jgi:hypothetical protein
MKIENINIKALMLFSECRITHLSLSASDGLFDILTLLKNLHTYFLSLLLALE